MSEFMPVGEVGTSELYSDKSVQHSFFLAHPNGEITRVRLGEKFTFTNGLSVGRIIQFTPNELIWLHSEIEKLLPLLKGEVTVNNG